MQSDMVHAAAGLLSALVVLLVGFSVLRACRNWVSQAVVVVVLGLIVAPVVGGVAAQLPAEWALILPILLGVRSLAFALCVAGVASVVPRIIGSRRLGLVGRRGIVFDFETPLAERDSCLEER